MGTPSHIIDDGLLLNFDASFGYLLIKGVSGQTTIWIISTNLGSFGANSVITFGLSCGIRWYNSIFQKMHSFPEN